MMTTEWALALMIMIHAVWRKINVLQKLLFVLVGILGSCLIKLLGMTLRIDDEPKGFTKKTRNQQVIYAFWHCMMLVPAYIGRSWRVQVLISQHSDGEYIAQVIKWMGFGVGRGSTTRGGMRATKNMAYKATQSTPRGR